MPELPEVENFRKLLLPLISTKHELRFERLSPGVPPRKFLSDDDIEDIHSSKFVVTDVCRKGKLIWMELTEKGSSKKKTNKYLSIHMGMTGRISNPQYIPKLMETPDTITYPPSHTHLKFVAGPNEACFSDPRKFGHVLLKESMDDEIEGLAPDARTELHENGGSEFKQDIVTKLTGKTLGIKALLLDQKRAVSGVGNWIADEVMYQMEMHPDQKHLTQGQAAELLQTLHTILETAVSCLEKDQEFPEEWLFHYRWTKGNRSAVKDFQNRSVTFVTSGGRTSAIVPSIQKLKGQTQTAKAATKKKATKKVKVEKKGKEKKETKPKRRAAGAEDASKEVSKAKNPTKKRKVEKAAAKSTGSRKSRRVRGD